MRNQVLDVIKGISIIMIVNVHLVSGQFFVLGKTYHVIAFFLVSGIIKALDEKWKEKTFNDIAVSRAKRLLYPYITLSVCYILFRLALNLLRGGVLIDQVIINASINTLLFRGIGTLWFLPILFFGEIFFYYQKKKGWSNGLSIVIGLISIFVAYLLDKYSICGVSLYGDYSLYGILNIPISVGLSSLIASFFICLGYSLTKNYPTLLLSEKLVEKKSILLVIILCLISCLIDVFFVPNYGGDLHKLNIGNPLSFLICSIAGLSMVLSVSLLIVKCSPLLTRFLSFLGVNSLIIMTTHSEYMINSVSYYAITQLFDYCGITLCSSIISLLSLITIIAIEIIIIYIINHSVLRYIYTIPRFN